MSTDASNNRTKSIFISYRRNDSRANTGRIYDRLAQEFSQDTIFKDVDSIPFGVDFREHLQLQVKECRVLLAVIGQKWNEDNRLKDDGDFVRIEIEFGLDPKNDIRIIPVLVENATMPTSLQLPESLKELAFRNAISVRPDPDFHKDVDKLITSLFNAGIEKPTSSRNWGAKTDSRSSSTEPYRIRGKEFFEPKGLAAYMCTNWDEGCKHFKHGLVIDWVKNEFKDQGLAIDLSDIHSNDKLNDHQKLSVALCAMNKELPIHWKGEIVSNEWLANHPEQSAELSNNILLDEYRTHCGNLNEELCSRLKIFCEIAKDLNLKNEHRKLVFDLALNPNAPLFINDEEVNPEWMSANPKKSIEICSGSFPKWHKRLRKEDWIEKRSILINEALSDRKLKEFPNALNSVISIILDDTSLPTFNSETIDSNWMNSHPEEACKIFKSSFPEWTKRLCGDNYLVMAKSDWISIWNGLQKLDLNLPKHRVDKLIFSSKEELSERFTIFAEKFAKGVYFGASDAKVQALLETEEFGRTEQIALLACDENIFLNEEEKILQDSKNYLKEFGASIDWKLANKLIEKNSWDFIRPYWLKAVNEPLAPQLTENRRIVNVYNSKNAEYLDVVALVASNKAATLQSEKTAGTCVWRFQSQSRIITAPAIGKDGAIFVGSDDKKLYAIDSRSGEKIWDFLTGGSIQASSSIGNHGTIFCVSSDGVLHAIEEATGLEIWNQTISSTQYPGFLKSSPSISTDGIVYVGSNDKNLYALDEKYGSIKWTYKSGHEINSSPAIGEEGTVYFGCNDYTIKALCGQTGIEKWSFFSGGRISSSPAISADGTLYIGSEGGALYAITGKTGELKWSFETNGPITSSPVICRDGNIFFGSHDHMIYAVDGSTGIGLWEFDSGYQVRSSPAIGSDGTIYFGAFDGKIYALDKKNGHKQWDFITGSAYSINSSPCISEYGIIYVGSDDGHLYALSISSRGLDDGPWPMFGQNLRQTGQAPIQLIG